jgi:DNA polymerase-4
MPSITAKRQCPDLIFVKRRFDAYKAVSLQIREIFAEHTPLIERLSLEEAYLDVTETLQGIGTATEIAEHIRAKILADTGLTASAGVSYNKFLAKLASDHRKPNGSLSSRRRCDRPSLKTCLSEKGRRRSRSFNSISAKPNRISSG